METIEVNGAMYHLPETEDDVKSLVQEAKDQNEIICMRGAAHSFPLIGTLEKGSAAGKNYKYVMLSKMNKVLSFDKKKGLITAQAGIHLGVDPFDPTGISTQENSLLYHMDQAGWAVGDLGGITHQTLAGFMSTGSAGGTTKYGFDEFIVSIDMICCTANGVEKVTFSRPVPDNPDDPFYGAALSMGLFGVIVSATLQCIPKFNISGTETISTVANCAIDLFGPGAAGKPGFQDFLTSTTYTRCMWWPQENIKKFVVWQAEPEAPTPGFEPKPYQEVPWVAGSPLPSTLAADLLFTAIGQWPDWLADIMGTNNAKYKITKDLVEAAFYPMLFPLICEVFVPVDDPKKGPQQFRDYWWSGLPMDNQMSDRLMPVWFTELWIPIDQSEKVMKALQQFYDQSTQHTGAFSCEIYAAKHSSSWLSPAYGTDVIRIDVFWFANTKGSPADSFYPPFWELLAPFNFRPHWGKFLPEGQSKQGADYLKGLYPKWNDWMNLRSKMDPNGIFLNDYWRGHLGIT